MSRQSTIARRNLRWVSLSRSASSELVAKVAPHGKSRRTPLKVGRLLFIKRAKGITDAHSQQKLASHCRVPDITPSASLTVAQWGLAARLSRNRGISR